VIYANDNFGRWRSRADAVSEQIRASNPAAWAALEPIHPQAPDYFVLKPRHSAFYGTPLALLLEALDVGRLLLTGVSATSCIWFTGADAHVRGFDVVVIRDAIAAPVAADAQAVAGLMRASLGAQVTRARNVRLRLPRHPGVRSR
jgi:nicotinamidase-related amidase